MITQTLFSNFTTTNVDLKTLAKSYFELANSKSQDWMTRLNLAIDASSVLSEAEMNDIINNDNDYSRIIDTALPLEDGSAISLREFVNTLVDADNDPSTTFLLDKRGGQHTVEDVSQYIADQGVNLTALTCAFQAVLDSSVDPSTGQSNVQFANYYTLVESQLGELSLRGKNIINYYYNILSDSTIDPNSKLNLILSPIQNSVTNYNEDDDNLDIEFFVPEDTYTGMSSFAAWCATTDISWDNTWNVIKGAFKTAGTIIKGLWDGVNDIVGQLFGYVAAPFNPDNEILVQSSKYTTSFIDVPVVQGELPIEDIFNNRYTHFTPFTLTRLCENNNIDPALAKSLILNKIPYESALSFDFTSFRILLWRNKDSDRIKFIVNVSPLATGSVDSVPVLGDSSETNLLNPYRIMRGLQESIVDFKTDVISTQIDVNDPAALFRGILASMNNLALITGAMLLTNEEIEDPVFALPAGADLTAEQAAYFERIASFMGGYALIYEHGGEQSYRGFDKVNSEIDHGTNGDWLKADGYGTITNSDVVRVVCNSYFNPLTGNEDTTNDAIARWQTTRATKILASVFWFIIRQKLSSDVEDRSLFLPYTNVYSTGTPRFVVKGDPSGSAFVVWLSGLVAAALTVVGISVSRRVRIRRQKNLAKWQASQWSYLNAINASTPGSTEYNSAVQGLMKTNKKLRKMNMFSEITGFPPITGLIASTDLINVNTKDIISLIRNF